MEQTYLNHLIRKYHKKSRDSVDDENDLEGPMRFFRKATWMGECLPVLPELLYQGKYLGKWKKSLINDYFTSHRIRKKAFRVVAEDMIGSDAWRSYKNHRSFSLGVFPEPDIVFELDLHGYRSRSVGNCVKKFLWVLENYGVPKVRIIHGGGYVLSEVVYYAIRFLGFDYRPTALKKGRLTEHGAVDVFSIDPDDETWIPLDCWL
jgi:hypothetical protein